jgi:hypothetical protein
VPTGDATIYVVGRGWHSDIGLPVAEVTGQLSSLERGFPGIRFMVFGFGERAYYMARHEGSGEMLTAMFPSKSAILMTALSASPVQAFADQRVVMLRLPRAAAERLGEQIWNNLEMQSDGTAVRLADGPYAGSVFFASRETYDLFYTCNTWTARLLRDAGFPVDPDVVFSGQLMAQVKRIAAAQSAPRP